jgi:hypothetical protein
MATRRRGKTVAELEAELRASGKYEEYLAARRQTYRR